MRLTEDLKQVQTVYGSRGFITATIKVSAEFDDAASTAVLRLEVKEGFVYHMGELEFRGLDNSLMAKLRAAWKLRPGDVYDGTYISEYLPAAQKLLPPSLGLGGLTARDRQHPRQERRRGPHLLGQGPEIAP